MAVADLTWKADHDKQSASTREHEMTFPTAQECKRVNEPLRGILAEFDERVRAELVAVAGAATANGVAPDAALRCATTLLMNLAALCARQCDDTIAAGETADFCSLAARTIALTQDTVE